MSGQENEEFDTERATARLNELLRELGEEDREIAFYSLRYEHIFSILRDELAKFVEPHQERRDALMDELTPLTVALEKAGGLKKRSLELPNGTVAIRDGRPTLVITDEKKLMNRLRWLRWLKQTTKQPPRVLVKDKIKKLPPAMLKRLLPYAHLEVVTRVTAKPRQTQVELTRDLNPHQRVLDASSESA